jgi:hypothetical protein
VSQVETAACRRSYGSLPSGERIRNDDLERPGAQPSPARGAQRTAWTSKQRLPDDRLGADPGRSTHWWSGGGRSGPARSVPCRRCDTRSRTPRCSPAPHHDDERSSSEADDKAQGAAAAVRLPLWAGHPEPRQQPGDGHARPRGEEVSRLNSKRSSKAGVTSPRHPVTPALELL